jgi:predicted hydrolase (HD superfamily)
MTVHALPTRDQALALVHEWIQNPNLRKHCYAVEAAMRAYARKLGEDEERWGLTGLIHDFDWERHPDAQRHPMLGVELAGLARGRVPRDPRPRHLQRCPA